MEKVENVVNPPHRPTVRNSDHELASLEVLLKYPQIKPIRRHPARFIKSVPQGKPLLTPFMVIDMIYLAAPPRKLPQPAIRIFFKISGSIVAFKILFPKNSECSGILMMGKTYFL